ncbi:hypothetical protein B0H34DRAFT_687431 [Crassisporium funariophilum]|nr:hypothetical protein B0H34DRAFT_687431 [Crassisporium funariophilum]
MMTFQRWSWIFIFQSLLVRPGYAHVSQDFNDILARTVMENVFSRGLTKAQKSRNAFIAIAITAAVVLVAGALGLYLFIRRQRRSTVEPEAGAVDKPSWWMVEGKNEKMDWWRLSHRIPPVDGTEPEQVDGRSRFNRLKAALQRKAGKDQPLLPTHRGDIRSPTDSLNLPMQTDPNLQPRYPDALERGFRAPLYPVESSGPQIPPIPSLTRTVYDTDQPVKQTPSVPPRAIVTQGRTLSDRRAGAPRSPASKRKSWLHRHSFRHPFLPLKDSEAPLPQISAPTPADSASTHPKLGYSASIGKPRTTGPSPLGGRKSSLKPAGGRRPALPAPLQLQDGEQPRKVVFGLPCSPRPPRNL